MATFSTQKAKASWQGNYDVYTVGGGNGLKILPIELEVTAAQLVSGNVFNLVKLDSSTAVIGGWLKTDTLDTGTAAFDMDVGYDLDSGTDDPNFFFEGGGAAASFAGNFIAGVGAAAAPFIPTDDYFVTVTITGTPGTAAAGTIYVYLLLADITSVNEAAS